MCCRPITAKGCHARPRRRWRWAGPSTDNVGCRETVVDGVNGFLVPVRDVDALVAAMEHFIAEPALIESMGRESRRLAEERFDIHRINAVMLEAMGIRAAAESSAKA